MPNELESLSKGILEFMSMFTSYLLGMIVIGVILLIILLMNDERGK